ncbi:MULTISPECIES: carbohydrate binding domain-containing protein [unclassified Fusibacter]|uniref:carbohydrate binding domain-containing protein n=1 Tax=unclassified Fusibacter TaxID=2624464 RepID=UPI001013B98E|nr:MULTISPECIES: carbohydrate binding domain-containing protein [unclassified Fusibacter]MCK8060696.1 carbohydrate binding domain-containing protein [Fusibacter sp. A2]NPE22850.1 family 16 glycosylhydrolase [Fusibacter sp. A1]RXV59919.1 hypothetical protein DWB64_13470 [Fusibacter sp. A1]
MRRFIALTVILTLILSTFMPSYASIGMNDSSDHWAENTISKWIDDGIVNGYEGGMFKPDASITRAEFYTLIHNVISLDRMTEMPFTDVKENDWYFEAVAFAYECGLTDGYPDGSFRPMNQITREEVAVVLSNLLELAKVDELTELSKFYDFDDSDTWNRSALESLLKKGLLTGYPDNTLRTNSDITRAEAVVLLDRIFGQRYLEPGTYGGSSGELETIDGNVTISAADVRLENTIIRGDVFITENVGEGEVHLANVTIEGDIVVKGGGENSLYFENVNINGALLVKKTNNKIRIVASGSTQIKVTVLASGAILLEEELEGDGFETVMIPAEVVGGGKVVLDGKFGSVSVEASDVNLEVGDNSTIETLVATETAAKLNVTGKGSIVNAEIKVKDVTVDVVVKTVVLDEGVTVTIGGQEIVESTNASSASSTDSTKKRMWTMTWNDEFNGSELDLTKWKHDIGNWIVDESGAGVAAGWGNNEKEFYTDSSDNAYVESGKLVIKAIKEETSDEFGSYDYTSAKLLTKGLFSQKYGRYEISAKLPVGKGLWPAIWMLPVEDVYGGWAASGELDIVEGWGSRPNVVAGTLHYGALWPNNKYSGKEYTFADTTSVNDFHVYAIEWEPGEIRWYVDGALYQTQNNWNTKDANGEEYSFPAPFDQEFYMIMNLAVGGNFDGEPTEDTMFPSTMEVDYVRVYELTGRDYMTPVEPESISESLPEGAKVADLEGNLLSNGDFSEAIQDNYSAELDFSDLWNLVQISDFGGSATQSIDTIDGSNYAKVDIADGGSQSYAVQLIQLTTLGKGRYYEVSFDAKSSGNRTMTMKMSAGEERGWTTYSDSYSLDLTESMTTYTKVFQMTAESDIAARLEMNLGLNANSVWIGNVKVREVSAPEVDYDASKAPLADGNGVYNGEFDKESVDRMAYWNLTTNGVYAYPSVSETTRRLFVNVGSGGDNASDVSLEQKGIQLEENTVYTLSLDAKAKAARTIEVAFSNTAGDLHTDVEVIDLSTEMDTYEFSFEMNGSTDLESILMIHLGGSDVDVYLDNIVLKATSIDYSTIDVFPLENGDFSDGLTGWSNYIHDDVTASIAVENDEVKIAADSVGAQTWGIQLYQGPFDFSNKVEYVVAFDVKSDVDRNLEVVIDNSSYTRYLSETVAATGEYTHYEYTLKLPVEDAVSLKFLLGRTDSGVTEGAHNLYIDNVVCEVKDASRDTNLIIKNGTFETDTDKWNLYIGDGSDGAISVSGEEMKIDFAAYAGWFKWSTQVYQDIIELEEGKTYELSFDARSTVDRDVLLQMTDLTEQTVPLTDTMTSYTYEFTATAATFEGKLNFLLGTDNMDGADFTPHSIYLDNISIVEVEQAADGSTVSNGYFDTDTTAWNLYTADGSDGSIGVSDEMLKVDFASYAGWFKWSTQVYQENIVLEAGKSYELTFDASSTVDRAIWLELNDLEAQELALTETKKTFTYKFTASESIENAKLNFLLGTDNVAGEDFVAHQVYLDNIELNESIVVNGYSDVNDIGWTLYANDGSSAALSTTSGAIRVDFSGYAGWEKWSTQVYQENIALEAGKSYELTFDASSTTSGAIWVELNGMAQQELLLTDTTETFTFSFTASESTANGKLNFLLGTMNEDGADAVAKSVVIDNVEINELIVSNGGFDSDIGGWDKYVGDGSDASLSSTNGMLKVDFVNYAGWFTYSTQLYQAGLELKAGSDYTVTFDASSTLDRNAWLEIDGSNGLEVVAFSLSGLKQTYTYDFTAVETSKNGKILFMLGTENLDGSLFTPHSVSFDNVTIVKK